MSSKVLHGEREEEPPGLEGSITGLRPLPIVHLDQRVPRGPKVLHEPFLGRFREARSALRIVEEKRIDPRNRGVEREVFGLTHVQREHRPSYGWQ